MPKPNGGFFTGLGGAMRAVASDEYTGSGTTQGREHAPFLLALAGLPSWPEPAPRLDPSPRSSWSDSWTHLRFIAVRSMGPGSMPPRACWIERTAAWMSPSYLSANSAIVMVRTTGGMTETRFSWRRRKAARVSWSHSSSWRVRCSTGRRLNGANGGERKVLTFKVKICEQLFFCF
jgi:hypothetical protein